MYDALTACYTFACPRQGQARIAMSEFRELERLPGAAHPAVYQVRFACPSGSEHVGLVSHDELDWAPLGLGSTTFLNLMTSKPEPVATELGDLAARQIGEGAWPWSFFCYAEDRARPVFPSAFVVLAPGESGELLALATGCPACGGISVNLVSSDHVDLPFHHDRTVGVVPHLFAADVLQTMERFREELHAESFDFRRLQLG